jgi:hypothetical protein
MFVNVSRRLEPQPTKIGVDRVNADGVDMMDCQCTLADDGVVDVCGRHREIVKVREGVEYVIPAALEEREVVLTDVGREGFDLAVFGIERLFVEERNEVREGGELRDQRCGYGRS